jgi:hypothetical protein
VAFAKEVDKVIKAAAKNNLKPFINPPLNKF